MRMQVTARHVEVSEELRVRSRVLLERLARRAGRAHEGRVIFGDDHGAATVEVRLHTARQKVLVGIADGADHRSALDLAAERVRRQIEKSPAKRTGPARRRAAARENK